MVVYRSKPYKKVSKKRTLQITDTFSTHQWRMLIRKTTVDSSFETFLTQNNSYTASWKSMYTMCSCDNPIFMNQTSTKKTKIHKRGNILDFIKTEKYRLQLCYFCQVYCLLYDAGFFEPSWLCCFYFWGSMIKVCLFICLMASRNVSVRYFRFVASLLGSLIKWGAGTLKIKDIV